MAELRQIEQGDIERFLIRGVRVRQRKELDHFPIEGHLGHGPAWSFAEGSDVIAMGGFRMMWSGVAHAWCYFSGMTGQQGRQLALAMRRQVDGYFKRGELQRLESTCWAENEAGCRLLVALGMAKEGKKLKYFYGRDYIVYGRV